MAKNCTYTYNGKQYSESELKNLLLNGELAKLVNDNTITSNTFEFLTTPKVDIDQQLQQRIVRNKADMILSLQEIFGLPKDQAEAVAKVYDASAQGMVNLGIYSSKEEYYANTPLLVKNAKPSAEDNVLLDQQSKELLKIEKDNIKKAAIKNGTFLKAPNGQPSKLTEDQWLTVRTSSFIKWFGDWQNGKGSKVIDSNGEPAVLYHWSPVQNIKIFNLSNIGTHFGTLAAAEEVNEKKNGGNLEFFDHETGEEVSVEIPKEDGELYPVFLNLKNPLRIVDNGQHTPERYSIDIYEALQKSGANLSEQDSITLLTLENTPDASFKINNILTRYGYDGFIYTNEFEDKGSTSYIVTNASSVKSVFNTGVFSASNPDIYYQNQEDFLRELINGYIPDNDKVARERFNIPSLTKLSDSGSDRDVFDLGDGKVLKVAKTARGLRQNMYEGMEELVQDNLLPRVFERGLNYVVVEKMDPIDPVKYKWFVNYLKEVSELVKEWTKLEIKQKQYKYPSKKDSKRIDSIIDQIDRISIRYGFGMYTDYPLISGDYIRLDSWGISKNGSIMLVDAGTLAGETLFTDYSGKESMDDADFKAIFQRSEEARKKFNDQDSNILYQNSSSREAVNNVVSGFKLIKSSKGFGNSFVTKTGKATPALAQRINTWLQNNGYNNIRFTYEATYGTLVPLVRNTPQQGLLFQDNSLSKVEENINFFNIIKPELDKLGSKWAEIFNKQLSLLVDDGDNIINTDKKEYNKLQKELRKIEQLAGNLYGFYPQSIEDNGNVRFLKMNKETFEFEAEYNTNSNELKIWGKDIKGITPELIIYSDLTYKYLNIPDNLLNQQAKGAIDLNKRIIYALTSPDVTTPLHEFAHLWLSDIQDAANKGNKQASAILDTLDEFAKSEEGQRFYQKQYGSKEFNPNDPVFLQELFARGFERYLADGNAPKTLLDKIFEMFKQWLKEIYKGITGSEIDIELNEPMKQVYSQILGKKITTKKKAETKPVTPTVESTPVTEENLTELIAPAVEVGRLQGNKFENHRVAKPKGFEEAQVYTIPAKALEITNTNAIEVEKQEETIEGTKNRINVPVVRLNSDGTFTIVSGNDAAQAVKNVGYELIPVVIENENNLDFAGQKEAVTPEEVQEEVVEETVEEVTPVEPIAEIQRPEVKFEEAEVKVSKPSVSMNEAARYAAAKTVPFENPNQNLKGISTGMFVEFKGKQYLVSSITDDGFLVLVSRDIIEQKGSRVMYKSVPTRADMTTAFPEMVTPVTTSTPTEEIGKNRDAVVRVSERIKQLFPQIQFEFGNYPWKEKGRFENGIVKLNLKNIDNETPIHEFLHPFILAISISNPTLYANLVNELRNQEYRPIIMEIQQDPTYAKSSPEDKVNEALVRIISRDIAEIFDEDGRVNEARLQEKRKSLTDVLVELFNYIMDLILGKKSNISIKNFIDKMNKESSLSNYVFKTATKDISRSKIDLVSLSNKTVIYINPEYFTPTMTIENLFYDIQSELSEEDYRTLVSTAKKVLIKSGKSKPTNPVRTIKYNIITGKLDVIKFSESTRKLQQKGYTISSVDDISMYMTPEEFAYVKEQLEQELFSGEEEVVVDNIDSNVITGNQKAMTRPLVIKDIPVTLTLSQLADFIITQDSLQFEYTQGEMDAIANLTAFYSKAKAAAPASQEVKDAIKRLKSKVENLKDVGNRRIVNTRGTTSPLSQQANALQDILTNQNEVEALLDYIRESIVSLDFAVQKMNMLRSDFYEKIGSNNITPEEINEFNRRFREVSTYYSYFNDISYLVGRFEDLFYETQPKISAKEELANIKSVLGKVELSKKNFQGLVTDMVTEWLYPYYLQQMEIIAERNKNLPSIVSKKIEGKSYITYGNGTFSIDGEGLKKHLKNQLRKSDEDASFITYLLGSTITSKDPVNAITSMILTDAIYENDEHADRLWVVLNSSYNKFLKDNNLPDDEKVIRQWYKDNYLRKAQVWEKTGWDEVNKVPIYGYVERLAYHQDKFYDLIEKDLRVFIESLPKPTTAEEYNENRIKIYQKRDELSADPKYINPKYQQLVKDEYYMFLYKNYELSNNIFGGNKLKFGIIGQVPSKISPITSIKQGAQELKQKVEEIQKEPTLRKKVKNAVKSTSEYLFDDNEAIDNVEYNFDESLYRNIRTSSLMPIQEEENLELLLHENLMVFTKDALKYSSFRNIQANIENLKLLIQGNPALGINPRKALKLNKKGNLKWYNFITLPKTKEDYQNRLNDQLVKQINDVVYGDDEEQSYLNVGPISVSLNNVGSNLGFATALLNMSGNVLAMTRNMTIGNVTNIMEAVGSRYVSLSDYKEAVKEYTSQVFNTESGVITDIYSRNKSKVSQMAMLYDAIQGEYRDRTGRIITENFTRRFFSKNSWFVLNHAAEHQIQLTMMIALMKGKKVKMADGTQVSLWDAYKPNAQGVYELDSSIQWTNEDTSKFRKELHSVLRELNGNYSELHKSVIQRSWWGKLLLVYRKYIYPQVRSRYGGFRMDYERGDIAYGYYRLFFKQLIDDIRTEGIAQALANVGGNLKNNDEKTYLNYATRKTIFELSTLTALLLLIVAMAPGDDDKEKISKFNAYVLWWLNSLYSDLGAYTFQSLPEIARQVKNPSAGNITLTKVTAFASQLFSDITSGELERYDVSGYGYEKGDTKLGTKFEKLVPIVNQINRAMNPEQQLQFFDLIGKRVRTD